MEEKTDVWAEQVYGEAEGFAAKDDVKSQKKAAELFGSISYHHDASERALACKARAEELEAQRAKKRKKRLIAALVVVIVIALLALLSVFAIVPAYERSQAYEAALAMEEEGDALGAFEAFESLGDYKDSEDHAAAIAESAWDDVAVGGHVFFGRYEQDNDEGNGPETIAWRVLAVEGDRALVISEHGLDAHAFNSSTSAGNDWETSELKSWLEIDFASSAFSAEDSKQIDGVPFCLSVEEAELYFSGDNHRVCYATEYVRKEGVKVTPQGRCAWWLRSSGSRSGYAAYVDKSGNLHPPGYLASTATGPAVRPALWVKL